MNVNDIANLSASLGNAAASSRAKDSATDPISKALTQANDRLEQQKKSAEVKLSSFGQVKSAVAELESSGKALSEVTTTTKAEEAKKLAQNFVTAFNNARNVANRAVDRNSESGTLADEGRARIAANELSRSLDRSTTNELREIGITANQDGTLKVDTQKLEQAFQSNPQQAAETLASAGEQAEQTASRQLSSNGNVGRSINSLNQQVQNLETQQQNQQNLIDAMQRNTEQANARLNAISESGIAAYQKILSL